MRTQSGKQEIRDGNRPLRKLLPSFVDFLVVAAMLISSACSVVRPVTIPPTSPAVTPAKTVAPSPTPDNLLPVVDDGSPLPPQLIELQPSKGQELPLSGEFWLTFDQAMDPGKTASALQISGPQGKVVQGQVSWPDARTLQFVASKPLENSATYQVSLSTNAQSAGGTPLQDPLEIQFETVGQLQVSQVFPQDGAQSIANDAVVTVIFNRPVVPLVIAEQQKELLDPLTITPEIAGHGEWVNTSVYAFHPDKVFRGDTTYTAVVKAGLADASGESRLGQDYTWQFTTIAPSLASLDLSSGVSNPDNHYQNVLLDEYFTLSFYQPMDRPSVEANLSLTSENGEPAGLITDWNEDSTSVIITPTQRLALGTQYNLILDASAQAEGGGSLSDGLDWNFTTIPAPKIVSVSPGDGVRQSHFDGQLMITFASPMNIETVKDKILIQPAPAEEIQWWYNDWDWSIHAFALQPSTSYSVKFLPGMEDIYGNQITREQTIHFTTGAYDPSAQLQMPYMPSVLRAGAPPEAQIFYATYRNVDQVSFKLYQIEAQDFSALLSGNLSQWSYTPRPTSLMWQVTEQSTGRLNQRVLKSYHPVLSSGDALPPGFYFLGMDAPGIRHDGQFLDTRLLVVATDNITFKSTNSEALLWVTDLNTGLPVSGVSLTVYQKDFQSIGQGVTDTNGLLVLDNIPAPAQPWDPRFAITEDGKHLAFASSDWGSGVNLYDLGIWTDYYSPANQPTVYVYTERPLYRPGQPVYFKGIVRMNDDLDYSLPNQAQVHVTIDSYKETVYDELLPLSDFGSFNGKLVLDSEAALGYYSLTVRFPGNDDQVIGAVGFSVAEYHRPEFQVKVTASTKDVLAGDNYSMQVDASYYSGGAVGDAKVDWTVSAAPFTFSPGGDLSGFSFSDFDQDTGFYDTMQTPGANIIAQGQDQTDAKGKLEVTLPADLSESNTSQQFTFEATLTDIAGNQVSGRDTVTAHRSAVYPGIRSTKYIGIAGEEQTLEMVAADWDGNPLSGQALQVEVVERRWYSVQTQDANGRVAWSSSVEDIPVDTFNDLTTGENGKVTVNFTPPKGGVYRARVIAMDEHGNEARASTYVWVSGDAFIPWRQTNDRSFSLVADRDSYQPGDTAQLLIASPFQGEAYALLTVERGHIRHEEVVHLTSNSTIYPLSITADMAPNAYVSVMIVKGVDETSPRPNYKMGMLELKVDTRQQALDVEVTPDKEQAAPGDQVTYTVTTRDMQGQPVSAEVSLGLSDLATLSLMDPNSPPILDFFYSHRNLSVWTSVPIGLSIEDYNAEIQEHIAEGEGMGSGGGKGEGDFGVIEVRQNFPDTAFWEADVHTDENGQATVTMDLPDNLTTWRMDARAVTQDTRVGQTTQDLVSTKPLLVRPQTPRFFVANDQVQLGTAVHNNTDQDMQVKVSLAAEGLSLLGQADQQLDIPARRQAYVSWEAVVKADAERVDLVFSAESGEYNDASRPPAGTLDGQGIPVYHYEVPETVGTSGQMLVGGSQVEAISLPTSFDVTQGDLTIQIAPSLAAGMTDGLQYLESYPYECVEQTISRFLPNVITTRALKSAGLSDPQLESGLETEVNAALQRLYNWQNPDGGWSWWSNRTDVVRKSDPQTSAYAVLGMVEAKEAGYAVSEPALAHADSYLRLQVRDLPKLAPASDLNRQAFILYVLARAGSPQVSNSVQLFDQRQAMALYARAFLAQTLYLIDPGDPRVKTLLSDLAGQAILSSTGSHWEEGESDYLNWNTDTRTTAIVLSALSHIDVQNPLNANAVRWLMSSRTDGHWQGTQETAWTLMALTNWMEASGELQANYQYAVALNGERLGGGTADAETLRQTLDLQVDVADLLKDQANRLVFARDDGPGNLYYTAHLNVSLPVERVEPLDQGIVVSRSYYPLVEGDASFDTPPITNAQQGELILVRLTLVAPSSLHYVVVEDPLPAGLEAVDQSLNASPQAIAPQNYNWNDLYRNGWGWWYFDYTQLQDEKVVLSAEYLPAGTYVYTYLARASTPGTFRTIPPTAQEFYFPEVYGRGAGSLFTVNP